MKSEEPDQSEMTLNPTQRDTIAAFRQWLSHELSADPRFGGSHTDDREDGSSLTTRWQVGESLWLQVALRPHIPEVRVGVVTDDRWKSEEMEQAIEDSGDSMYEFVGLGFGDAGLDWEEPPVEHHREQLKWMTFITPLELDSLEALAEETSRRKVKAMADGYCIAFESFLHKPV